MKKGSIPGLLRGCLRVVIGLVVIGVLGILLLGGYAWMQHNRQVILPKPSGTYGVGRIGYDWTDASRVDILSANPQEHRELMVWVWYPASPTPTDVKADYLPQQWRAAREADRGFGAILFTQNEANVQTHSFADTRLAAADKPYPVIIFQPGLGPVATDYTTLAEDLASRGYVVMASTPTYSANMVVFADGRTVSRSPKGTVADDAAPQAAKAILDKLVNVWAADNIFMMNQAAKLNAADPAGRFTGKLDMNEIGIFGHSFGGASAAQTCSIDPRCKAGIDLDGTPYGAVVHQGMRQPFMFLWSEPTSPEDVTTQQTMEAARSIASKNSANTYQFEISGMRHFNFSDYAVAYQPVLKWMGGLGSINGQRGLKITTAYTAAFFDQTLKGVDSPLLKGTLPEYPEVHAVR